MKYVLSSLLYQGTVTFRPAGNSMTPLIHSKDEVVVVLCDPSKLEPGDIVLVKVKGGIYLHLIKSITATSALIGNNHGRINGWTPLTKVYGIATSIAGTSVSSATTKVVPLS